MSSYETETYWKQYQSFVPANLRVLNGNQPEEEWFPWRGASIHIDRFPCPSSLITVIVVHGAGGYGRLFSPIGRLLQDAGYEVVAPDLPGYGLSHANSPLIVKTRLVIDAFSEQFRAFRLPILECLNRRLML